MARLFKLMSAAPGTPRTWRDFVAWMLVFGCIPALVLSILAWLIALAFVYARPLPMLLAWLITLFLVLISLVLVIIFADRVFIHFRMYITDPTRIGSDSHLWAAVWSIILSLGLLLCDGYALFNASTLEIWHLILIGSELLLVGYQAWRVFQRRQYQY